PDEIKGCAVKTLFILDQLIGLRIKGYP
ncbi:LOW QUALITY PROTEIN: hypothetical protein PanWU01x14_058790, partial [Parasponia andersonii]